MLSQFETIQNAGENLEIKKMHKFPTEYEYEGEPIPGFEYSYEDENLAKNSFWAKVMNSTYDVSDFGIIGQTKKGKIDIVVIAPPSVFKIPDPVLLSESTADFSRLVKEQTETILSQMPLKWLICQKPPQVSSGQRDLKVSAFRWLEGKENSTNNNKAYLAHIQDIPSISSPFHVFDRDIPEANLKMTLGEMGNADVLISSSDSEELAKDTCHILFEIQKPTETKS
ncbi:hypothetical protein HK096_005017 [Nowakowskiella sp. JEL0078]|nr:hypothetical protein HK096_005017 [Nowakowskiella sp. JEL0078]